MDQSSDQAPKDTPSPPPEFYNSSPSFYRYASETEARYLQQAARKDAWVSLNQWFLPAMVLSLLSIAYWIWRHDLQVLLQRTDNPREYSIFIGFILNLLVALLHLALVAYLFKLQRMLRYFSKQETTSEATTGAAKEQQVSPSLAIFRISGPPSILINLVLTSRSGLRRYRWHYYLDEIPLSPLPSQRKILPLFAHKKSWENLSQLKPDALLQHFPQQHWLSLEGECRQRDCHLSLHLVKVAYYDFRFYYLCAIDPAPFPKSTISSQTSSVTAISDLNPVRLLLQDGTIACASDRTYSLDPQPI